MMLTRRCTLLAGSLLFLALLSVLPASAAGPSSPACAALLPWEEAATGIVNPVEQDQTRFIFNTSCTSSSQCPSGQVCHCGQCHTACATGWRWSCGCQVCYKCPTMYFFDESLCACAHV